MRADTLARIVADRAYDAVYLKVMTKLENVYINIGDIIDINQVLEVGGSFVATGDGFDPIMASEELTS